MKYSEGYLLDNRYQLERFIGSGTFGEVWVAIDKATDIEVAIKVYVSMDEKGLEEFKKEFQISFELNHTNLLHANYLGVNSEDKRPYLVMPFCPEGSVSRFSGEMSEADLWRFIRDVASGLAYLHSKQPPIIHQDIKPDNILIVKNGDFVITDFGISKQLRATLRKSATSLNSAGAISYMGPERFSKQYQAVKASDIWSLGVSIFELATNELPFCGMGGSLLKQGADMPELPEEFSETLNMVCQSCMAKEPWNRPTAQQLADFAAKHMDGENPKPAWIKEDKASVKEDVAEKLVEERIPVAVKTYAEPVKEEPEVKLEKKTVIAAGNLSGKTVRVGGGEVVTPPDVRFVEQKPDQKPLGAAVWVAAAAAGMVLGFILNYFI
jgi:serine/threonine protein kinase